MIRWWGQVNLVRWGTWLLLTTANDIFQNIPMGGDVDSEKQLGILKVVSLFGQCSHQVPRYSLSRSCFKITSDRVKWSYCVHSHLSGIQVWTQHYYVLVPRHWFLGTKCGVDSPLEFYQFRGLFLERPSNFSGLKANFEIKTFWIVAQCLAHKSVNLASLTDNFIVPFSKLFKLWSWVQTRQT